MSIRDDVREFLTSRRARITPGEAGLPTYGEKRRVPGLRREEVALLAGVSADYYTKLERGNLNGVSEQVLDALARALKLDEAEHAHLLDLSRASSRTGRPPHRAPIAKVRPGVLRLVEAFSTAAYVRNRRMDVLAANNLAVALYDGILDSLPTNLAQYLFLDERAHTFYPEWQRVADDAVAALRGEAGRNPHDKSLSDLVGELATRSTYFSERWARHDVRHHRTVGKRIHNSVVGELDVTGEALELPGDGLVIVTYTAEPDSATAQALRFLDSWSQQQVGADQTTP